MEPARFSFGVSILSRDQSADSWPENEASNHERTERGNKSGPRSHVLNASRIGMTFWMDEIDQPLNHRIESLANQHQPNRQRDGQPFHPLDLEKDSEANDEQHRQQVDLEMNLGADDFEETAAGNSKAGNSC